MTEKNERILFICQRLSRMHYYPMTPSWLDVFRLCINNVKLPPERLCLSSGLASIEECWGEIFLWSEAMIGLVVAPFAETAFLQPNTHRRDHQNCAHASNQTIYHFCSAQSPEPTLAVLIQ